MIRRNLESATGSQIEFPNEDFDDNKKSNSNLYKFTQFAIIVMVICGLFFFSSYSKLLLPNPSKLLDSSSITKQQLKGSPFELLQKSNFNEIRIISSPTTTTTNTDSATNNIKESNKGNTEDTSKDKSKDTIIADLNSKCQIQIEAIRQLKSSGVVMERDADAQEKIKELQRDIIVLLKMRYGDNPKLLVEIVLKFPKSMLKMPDYVEEEGTVIIELAPIEVIPYSVYYWLELVRRFKHGVFHRRAGHVLQASMNLLEVDKKNGHVRGEALAFQEYSPMYPHKKLTLGYAGRPGGPSFYISTIDNTQNHGPASQGSGSEADSCFGSVVQGAEVVERMKKQPGGKPPNGFVSSDADFIEIMSLKLLP